jgi:hypothetical protein
MRIFIFIITLAGLAAWVSPGKAQALPWCAILSDQGGSPDCRYATFEQCSATVSGLGGDCIRNPASAVGPVPQPRRRYGY